MPHVMLGVLALYITTMLTVVMRAATLEAFAFGVLRLFFGRTSRIVLMLILRSRSTEGSTFTALLVCHSDSFPFAFR